MVEKFDDYVDLTTVANLDRRPERMREISTDLEREGIKYHRLAAIDGQKRLPMIDALVLPERSPETVEAWDLGIYGCNATIYMGISLAKYTEARTLLYLEDDALLPRDFARLLARSMETVPRDWDVINFGPWHRGQQDHANNEWVLNRFAVNTHCMLIRNTAFDLIQRIMETKRGEVERLMRDCSVLRSYSPTTFAVPQRIGFSDVAQTFFGEDRGRVDPALFTEAADGFLIRKEVQHSDREVFNRVVNEDYYECETVAVDPNYVMDLGAHVGSFTHLIRKHHSQASIVAVEPDPSNLACLAANHQDSDQVRIIAGAVGSVDDDRIQKLMTSVYTDSSDGSASVMENVGRMRRIVNGASLNPGPDVNVYSIRELMSMVGWSHIDILKVSVNGSEYHALRDAPVGKIRCIVGEWHDFDLFQNLVKSRKFQSFRVEIMSNQGGIQGHFRLLNKDLMDGTD